jgi:DNA-directed RNA polymerase subunit H
MKKIERKSRPAHYSPKQRETMKKLDITKHALIPKHSKLSDKEKEELLKNYNIVVFNLPRIYKSDSAVESLGAKPGDVIKIVRKSPTAGESVFYRVVMNA